MSAQSLLNTLGSAGAAAGEDKSDWQQRNFVGRSTAQEMAIRLATLQRQAQVADALDKYRATMANRPQYTPGRTYKGEDGKWYTESIDQHSGDVIRREVGTPESTSNVQTRDADTLDRQKQLQDMKAKLATDLEASRAKHAQELAKFRSTHRASSGAAGAVPLAAERWYKTLGGSQVDLQIKSLESMLKSMELTSLGGPEQLYQNGLYVKTQQQLAALYQKADSIMQQSMQRAGGATAAPGAPQPGGSIVVTQQDMAGPK